MMICWYKRKAHRTSIFKAGGLGFELELPSVVPHHAYVAVRETVIGHRFDLLGQLHLSSLSAL